jgi:hypothetical protein
VESEGEALRMTGVGKGPSQLKRWKKNGSRVDDILFITSIRRAWLPLPSPRYNPLYYTRTTRLQLLCAIYFTLAATPSPPPTPNSLRTLRLHPLFLPALPIRSSCVADIVFCQHRANWTVSHHQTRQGKPRFVTLLGSQDDLSRLPVSQLQAFT